MKNQSRLLFLLLLFVVSVLPNNSDVIAQSNGGAGAPQPPMAEKKTKTTNIHGERSSTIISGCVKKRIPRCMAHLRPRTPTPSR